MLVYYLFFFDLIKFCFVELGVNFIIESRVVIFECGFFFIV